MKILYDYQISCRQKYGGISRYFRELIKYGLKKEILDISFFQGFHINCYHIKSLFKEKKSYWGLLHKKIPKTGAVLSALNKILFKLWIMNNKNSYDIYHPTYYDNISFNKSKKCKTIVTVYDMIHEKFSKHLSNASRTTATKRLCIAKAAKIIAVSHNTKKDLIECLGTDPKKIEVIHLAASELFRSPYNEDSKCFKREYNITKPYILFVGERGSYKNFITLLQTYSNWSKRKDFDLICAGGNRQWSRNEAKIINDKSLNDFVRIIADIEDKLLHSLYSNAYVYIIPSLYEGFGIPPLEAMSCGTPVIAAQNSSIPEVLGDAPLYFDALSCDELKNRLDCLVSNNSLRENLIKKGLEQSRLFSWEKTSVETFNLYRRVLS